MKTPWWEERLPPDQWEEAKITDLAISRAVLQVLLTALDSLKQEPLPISFGRTQYFKSLMPNKTPDELLDEPSAYWWGYAETLREFQSLLESLPKQEFVSKKK